MINNWKDVNINTFLKMQRIPKDDDFTFNLVALLAGKTLDEVLEQPLAVTQSEIQQLVFIEKSPKAGIMKMKYKVGNTTYRPQLRLEELTTAQYIDFQCLPEKGIVETLACVLIPEGKTYNNGYSKDDVIKELGEHMSIEDALSVCSFFTKWSEILQKRMIKNLTKMLRKAIRKAPTKELKKQMKAAYKELSSVGWERLMQYLNSPEYLGNESMSIR